MSTPLHISSGDERALGRSLRSWRALRRIKQLHAAQLLGVSKATVSRWENEQSAAPVHLVCDLTHRLLAASPAREAQFKVPTTQLLGASLWRYASEDIVLAESRLADHGWFGPAPPAIEFSTRARDSEHLAILACEMRWVRFQLSDDSFARLVESIAPLGTTPGHGEVPASQSASSVIDAHSR